MAADKRVRQLFEEAALFLQRRPHRVGELLRAEAKFKERLIVLPAVHADENRDEQPKAKQHWNRDRPDPRSPQSRGSAASTNSSGRATSTPSVSPAHHVVQFDGKSPELIAPRAHIPPNERLALVRQNSGESTSNSRRSRGLSNGAGCPITRRSKDPPSRSEE